MFTNCGEESDCPAVYDPICGTDGNTYDNSCQAEAAGIENYSSGECADDGSNKDDGAAEAPIYLAENGITMKASSAAVIGEHYELNDVNYLVVDSALLFGLVLNLKDLTQIVTTNVKSMNMLFLILGNVREQILYQQEFNQDISSWDVSNVTNMSYMFYSAQSFNQDISSWDVSNVKRMDRMFSGSLSFDQNISSWNVSNVTKMDDMFYSAQAFNGNIKFWDVSNVTDMHSMFSGADAFSINVSSWDVSNVTNMQGMFASTASFNQDIGSWDVSSVTDMATMFSGSLFNQDISSWDVSHVTNMQGMFKRGLITPAFNQDLSSWNVKNVTSCKDFCLNENTNLPISSWTQPKPNFTNCTE